MKMFIAQRKTSLGTHFLGHVSESQTSLNNYDLFFFFCINVANNCTFGIFDIFALFKITLSLSLLSLSASSSKNFFDGTGMALLSPATIPQCQVLSGFFTPWSDSFLFFLGGFQ